jgi:hypothetical protein
MKSRGFKVGVASTAISAMLLDIIFSEKRESFDSLLAAVSKYVSFDQLVPEPISPFRQVASWPSLVIRRQLLLRVALRLIVVNPELRMFLRHDRRYLVHGPQ